MPKFDFPPLSKIKEGIEFYDHQYEGVNKMIRMGNVILSDEMGLGKSLQTLVVLAYDFERGKAKRAIIVCTNSLKYNWADECEKFTRFKAMVLDGTPRKRLGQLREFLANDFEVLIVSYEQLKIHKDELMEMGFDFAIYDEAHAIKNPQSKRTKAALAFKTPRTFILTGSPLLNRVNEMWVLLHKCDPLGYPKYWTFVHRYCVFGGYEGREIVGVKNQSELKEKISGIMLRRLKKDVLNLPDKQRIKVLVDMTPDQRRMYDQANKELMIELPSTPDPMELENALTKFLRLKQICSTTYNLDKAIDHSEKLDRAVEMIQELIESGESVVVFTQFRGTIEALNIRLSRAGTRSYQLHGDVPASERQNVVRRWTAETKAGEPSPLICMLQVAGVGLNLTAANTVIFLDKLFVPKLNEQAEDRVHRIGVDVGKPIRIFELVARKTIEQRIEAILATKNKLFDEIVEGSSVDTAWKRKLIAAALAAEGDDD